MEPEVRYCTTDDGVLIAYTDTGSGPSLLLCSEPMGSHAQLRWSQPTIGPFLRELTRRNRLVLFDPRGTGLSERVHGSALEDYVRDIDAVVKHTGLYDFGVTAIQLATPAAIAFVARHPEEAKRLVLVEGFARYRDCLATPQAQALIAAAKADFVLASEAIGFAVFGFGRDESRQLGAYVRACIDPGMIRQIDVAVEWDVSELLPSIAAPTLVLKFDELHFVPMPIAQDLAASIPNAQLTVLKGNWAHDPEAVARRIAAFINRETEPIERQSIPAAMRSLLLTVLFTDLVDHSEMMSRLGDERGRAVLREHERIARDVLKMYGGTEIKTMGDGFMASFGSVTKAVECAIALQSAIDERNRGVSVEEPPDEAPKPSVQAVPQPRRAPSEQLAIRVGLNAGEPIEEKGDLFGATVILASRIAARAEGGEILVADTVRGLCSGKGFLFADRGEFVAKGFEEPVRVYEVRWHEDE